MFRCDVRRQKANDLLARAADDEAMLQELGDDRSRRTIELDAPDEAFAADVDDRSVLRFHDFQFFSEPVAERLHLGQKLRRLDLIEHGCTEPARQRIAAECRAVMARFDYAFER